MRTSRKEMIKGIIPPIITPMKVDETVNEQELRNQVNRLIEAGVHGLFAFGTNGEGYILSDKEKEKVLSVVIEEAAGRVPIYAGTGCVSTKETIEMSKLAQRLGADVLSIITPWFAKASQEELAEHYTAVAEEVELPIVLYNIPARTGNALAPKTVKNWHSFRISSESRTAAAILTICFSTLKPPEKWILQCFPEMIH